MDPGPSDASVLTRQAEHRSTWIWNGPDEGEDMPGVLKCRHRFVDLLRHQQLDPRIIRYIDEAGLSGLYGVPFISLDHALITALVERWRPETHTFHLPYGEMTITLQDMEVMMGLPVEGLPVIGKTNLIWEEECERLLGVKPPAPVPKPNQNKSVLDGTRIKSKWLANRFRAPLPENASEDLVQQYARYYLLELLGGSLFMDTSGGRISLLYLQFLDPISDAKKYSWGSAALAWLYRQLCNATDLKAKHISGALLLVQLWAFSRFPHMVPKMKEPLQGALDQELPLGPHAIRWQGAKCTKNAPTHVLEAYRASFSTTQAHQIVWEPYKEVLSTLPTYCTAGQRVWRSVVPLICFWIVEFHHPERVLRQFGMQQGEPPIVNTSVRLHGITLRAKMDKDWRKEHAVYIQEWDSRDQRVHDAPVFDGVMQYNHSYMKWYRRITRCHISRNSAKWDIIVNTQLRMLSRCQPNSENYKDIMDVLDLVGEMNRVNLDSACTVSSTRTPAAGHGGRSGGRGRQRGGRGGRRGGCGFGCGSSHDQEHSDSDEYPPSAADTDSDSDYGLSIDDTGIRPCMIHDDIGPSTTHDAPPSPLPTTLHDDIGPSYTHDASSSPLPLTPNDDTEPSTTHGTPWFPLPSTPMSATLTTNVASTDLAGGSSRIFIPILGLPTPHHHFPTRSAQIHSLPKPQQEVARVEQPHSENVEQLEPPPPKYLKRTRNEESSCGTGEEIALETTTMDDCAASLASLSSASTGDTTDCALACPSNSLPTQLTTTSIAEQNPSSLLVQQQVPTLTWPKNSELDLDWIENLISIFDWSSKNLPPSEFPLVLPVQAFDTLILTASKILHKEPNCITIDPVESSSVVVVGDIHGQLHDLIFLLKHAGFPSQNRFFVFNGDYVDRGAWGLESFLLLLAWKVFMPDRVFLLRGNHESKYCTSNYGFEKEVLTKYGDSGKHVYRKCLGCFEELPLASIIAGCVYTAHGGLFRSIPLVPSKRSKRKKRRRVSFNSEPKSLSLGSLEELSGARRSVLDPPWEGLNLIPGDVLWSDPSMTPGLSLNEERGIGLLWGPDCTEDFLKKINLKLIIRSHEGPDAREKRTGFGGMDEGYTIDHVVESGKLITVFSAPDYPQFQAGEERYKNKGAYVVLEPPNFDNPKFYSFEAVAPRPQVNPYYDYVDVIDSDEELDLASMATSAYQ